MRLTPIRFLAFLLTLCRVFAAHPDTQEVLFEHTHDVGFGNSLYVVGEHPLLGDGDPAKGVQMRYTSNNLWQASVAIPPTDGPLSYRYVSRSTAPDDICNSANATDIVTGLSLEVTQQTPTPFTGKTIYYASSWPQVVILYRDGDSDNFLTAQLVPIGAGRVAGEQIFHITGIGEPAKPLEFVFHDGVSQWDNAFNTPGANYLTTLDFIHVQDGHVFNYQPPATLSAPRVEQRTVNSTVAGIDGRTIRIYLPRGYDNNPDRRYPVLYMHDGQNVFSPGGTFGSWDADLISTAEIQMGRMRECIIVGIDNNPSARLSEYLPPTDNFNGQGRGDDYLSFFIDNVRPTVDTHYRTLTNKENTLLMGSSFGGIITVYMGWDRADIFGKLGIVSPAWWAIPNLRNQLLDAAPRSERIYLDWGTEESSGSADASTWWPPFLDGYAIYLSQGYTLGGNYKAVVGCGQAHNEAAWASRLPDALRFLLNPADEANELIYSNGKPKLELQTFTPQSGATLQYAGYRNYAYTLETLSDLTSGSSWQPISTQAVQQLWSSINAQPSGELSNQRYYRIRAESLR